MASFCRGRTYINRANCSKCYIGLCWVATFRLIDVLRGKAFNLIGGGGGGGGGDGIGGGEGGNKCSMVTVVVMITIIIV